MSEVIGSGGEDESIHGTNSLSDSAMVPQLGEEFSSVERAALQEVRTHFGGGEVVVLNGVQYSPEEAKHLAFTRWRYITGRLI